MGDGWETRRSRDVGHKEWVVVKLCGGGGKVEYVEVDSAFHMGNFPKVSELREAGLLIRVESSMSETQLLIRRRDMLPPTVCVCRSH